MGGEGEAKEWLGTFKDCDFRMVGEVIPIEPLLPCGKTYRRRQLESHENSKKGESSWCGQGKDAERCTIIDCPRGARGKIVKKDPNKPTKVPEYVQSLGSAVELVKGAVKEMYEAGDELTEKERKYK
jgi:hypothetical protein